MLQHKYIAIEGPIGVGKTSLAEILAKKLNARLVLEGAMENPFIHTFYKDMKAHAFQTQLFFLLSRYKQQQEMALKKNNEDAEVCRTCGSSMIRQGSCYYCTSCGETSGCS